MPLVFISGPMGSGKSTLAPLLASRLSVPAFDLDALIEAQERSSIWDLFQSRGEAEFRAIERAALDHFLKETRKGVVALGGGTVVDDTTRRKILESGIVITLSAPIEELARRVATSKRRPLLAGSDAQAVLHSILQARRGAYAECHHMVQTASRSMEDVVNEVVRVVHEQPVVVPLRERTYRVEIGPGFRERVASRIAEVAKSTTTVMVTDQNVAPLWGKDVVTALTSGGRTVIEAVLSAGEQHKTIRSVETIWDAALNGGVDRHSGLVAVGGGVIGDVAGFAASTLLRGISFGQVPTTLLAMVDSAVGGKTGFDRPQGKNLVGTFCQPSFVLCDVETLKTLPVPERIAGLAEVVKSAWLDGESSVATLEQDADALVAGDIEATRRAIRMAVSLKARIVARDENESGLRMTLNLGHTVGHALEVAGNYSALRHGEAVALGMIASFQVAECLGVGGPDYKKRATQLLQKLGLPVDLASRLNAKTLDFLGTDKKRQGNHLHFVVPTAPGETTLRKVTVDDVRRCLLG